MENLPPEVIVLILLFLRVEDALSLSAVSRTLRSVVTSCSRYWREGLRALGHSPQSVTFMNQWDAFLSYCRQTTEVKRMFAVDCERLPSLVGPPTVDGILTTTLLAGGSCLVRGLSNLPSSNGSSQYQSETHSKMPGVSYGMECYRGTSEGAIHKVWSLGGAKKCVLFATNPIAPFLVVLTRASRGVKLKWVNVTSGVTLWKSELDKLPRMKHMHTNRPSLYCDQYPSHGVLCPHCGAVVTIRSQSATRGRGIAIIYVPDTPGGAHQFVPHTFTCHIVESDQCISQLHDCLVVLVKASPPVSAIIDANPPKPCREHELVTYCSSEGGKCSVIRSVIRYDVEAKRFQYHILSVAPSPVSAKLDMVAITTSPLYLVTLHAVNSEVHEDAHLHASIFDVETMECVRSIALEHEFYYDINQAGLPTLPSGTSVSVHLCTACFLVLFVRDYWIGCTKYLCFCLDTGKCVGQLEIQETHYRRHAVVMNQALLESPVHVSEDQLYKLPPLAILHGVPLQSRTHSSSSDSKCVLM